MNDLTHNMHTRVMIESFKNWASKDKNYKKLFKKLDETSFSVITSAMSELDDYKPGRYEWWWAKEHPRFKIKGEQQRLVHELLYQFLTRYARGTLKDDSSSSTKSTKKTRRSTKTVDKR